MSIRTTRSHVCFSAAFTLAEIEGPLPPGTYGIDTEEEIVEGNTRTVYVRTATAIEIRNPGKTRYVTIDPAGLERALEIDGKTGS